MECCGMKGFLSYIILWSLRKGAMTGAELASELERRKGTRPSPGTIYPALKEMRAKRLVSCDARKAYSLTKKGEAELESACGFFCGMFYDMGDMLRHCPAGRRGKPAK